jgi:hypothetical protein
MWIGFIDLLCGFLFMIILQVNPKAVEAKEVAPPPGNVFVTVSWGKGDSDVDVWLSGPDEPVAVGYSNKNGTVWDLLRDDTGVGTNDKEGLTNVENAYTSGLPDGEYIVNVHAYGLTEGVPFPVRVEVLLNTGGSSTDTVYSGTVTFEAFGEELTVVRFSVRNHSLDRGSIHSVPIKLRTGNK